MMTTRSDGRVSGAEALAVRAAPRRARAHGSSHTRVAPPAPAALSPALPLPDGVRCAAALQVVPYRAAHLEHLLLQPAQAYLQPLLATDYAQALEGAGAFSALVGARVIGCGGIHVIHPRRGLAWALVARDAGAHFVAIHRAVLQRLEGCPLGRVEAHIDRDFAAAQRWARLLGFVNETPQGMRAFTPDGRDCDLYARVRDASAVVPPRI